MANEQFIVRALVEGGQMATDVAKQIYAQRKERQQMERQARHEKEIAEIKAGGRRTATTTSTAATDRTDPADELARASEVVQEYGDLLARAEQKEECDFCRALIAEVRSKPIEDQRSLVPELQAFLETVKDNASREELLDRIEGNDRLSALVEDVLGVDPTTVGDDAGDTGNAPRQPHTSSGPADGDQTTLL
jgi:hypothetical protein